MEREKIKLSVSELNEVRCDEYDAFELIESNITGTFRHGNENTAIIKRLSDNKFFEVSYRDSVKDGCDFADMNYDGEYEEVFAEKHEVTIYK